MVLKHEEQSSLTLLSRDGVCVPFLESGLCDGLSKRVQQSVTVPISKAKVKEAGSFYLLSLGVSTLVT